MGIKNTNIIQMYTKYPLNISPSYSIGNPAHHSTNGNLYGKKLRITENLYYKNTEIFNREILLLLLLLLLSLLYLIDS